MSKDVVIVGAGPSALTAAIYLSREDVDTTLYERGVVGGMAAITDQIDNYPGFAEGVTGMKLASELQQQAERFGAKIEYGDVTELKQVDGELELTIDGQSVRAKSVLLATGSNHRKLGVSGEDELYGRGVHYCATCDGAFYRDKNLIVVGGGNSAVQEAIFLTRYASHIDLLVRSKLRASDILQKDLQKYVDDGKITVHIGATTDEIIVKDDKFYGVKSTQNGEQKEFTDVHRFLRLGSHLSSKDKLFVRNYPYLFLNSYYICGEIGEIRNNQSYNISLWNIISEKLRRSGSRDGWNARPIKLSKMNPRKSSTC